MSDPELAEEASAFSRRAFVKKLVALGFAVPVVSTFALDAASAGGTVHTKNTVWTSNTTVSNTAFCYKWVYPHEETCFGGEASWSG